MCVNVLMIVSTSTSTNRHGLHDARAEWSRDWVVRDLSQNIHLAPARKTPAMALERFQHHTHTRTHGAARARHSFSHHHRPPSLASSQITHTQLRVPSCCCVLCTICTRNIRQHARTHSSASMCPNGLGPQSSWKILILTQMHWCITLTHACPPLY